MTSFSEQAERRERVGRYIKRNYSDAEFKAYRDHAIVPQGLPPHLWRDTLSGVAFLSPTEETRQAIAAMQGDHGIRTWDAVVVMMIQNPDGTQREVRGLDTDLAVRLEDLLELGVNIPPDQWQNVTLRIQYMYGPSAKDNLAPSE